MPNAESTPEILYDQQLESTLASVDASEEIAKSLASQLGYDEEETYHIGYAVREAVVNAVVHGNLYSADKRVRLLIERASPWLQVTVEDEGQGFEESRQADPLADENLLSQSGRGILIIRAFMDEVAIGRSASGGTRILMRKSLPPPA
jgi:serine/threonine-protein kinase RsbW